MSEGLEAEMGSETALHSRTTGRIAVCTCDDGWAGYDCSGSSADGSCSNDVLDGEESDVDCGGDTCDACLAGQVCASDGDCGGGLSCFNAGSSNVTSVCVSESVLTWSRVVRFRVSLWGLRVSTYKSSGAGGALLRALLSVLGSGVELRVVGVASRSSTGRRALGDETATEMST